LPGHDNGVEDYDVPGGLGEEVDEQRDGDSNEDEALEGDVVAQPLKELAGS
jgi:hypothetical protein